MIKMSDPFSRVYEKKMLARNNKRNLIDHHMGENPFELRGKTQRPVDHSLLLIIINGRKLIVMKMIQTILMRLSLFVIWMMLQTVSLVTMWLLTLRL